MTFISLLLYCYRDLKPENVLFATEDKDSELKISDFGFAKRLLTKEGRGRTRSQLGTLGYAAPVRHLH